MSNSILQLSLVIKLKTNNNFYQNKENKNLYRILDELKHENDEYISYTNGMDNFLIKRSEWNENFYVYTGAVSRK